MDWDDLVDSKILGPNMVTFGTAVTYLPITGPGFDIRAIYDKAFFGVDPATGSVVVTNQPTLGMQLSQFRLYYGTDPVTGNSLVSKTATPGVQWTGPIQYQPRKNDQIIIKRSGEQFVVREIHPDGHGAARLMLNTLEDEDG